MKKCPYCAEDIQAAAIKCRHCGSLLETSTPFASAVPVERFPSDFLSGRQKTLGLLAIGIGFLISLMSSRIAGLGILVMWVGLAFTMKGSAIVRWGGGFVLALLIGAVSMSVGSRSESVSAPVSAASANNSSVQTGAAPQPSTKPVPGSCLKIDTFDSSVLSSNDVYTELAWKVDVINSCDESFSAKVTFTISDKDDFQLDTDSENVFVPANGTGNARGKMLVSPPEKARRMAKHGASVRVR